MANQNKRPIFLYVALILFILLILSMHFSKDLYGRYFTTTNGQDGARVATFEVDDGFASTYSEVISISAKPGDQKEFAFTVINKGEVAVRYTVSANNLTNNLPLTFVFTPGVLSPKDTQNLTFTVVWDDTILENTNPNYANKTDFIELTIVIEQID